MPLKFSRTKSIYFTDPFYGEISMEVKLFLSTRIFPFLDILSGAENIFFLEELSFSDN